MKTEGRQEKNIGKIKAVIFDFDDTLVRTKDLAIERHLKAAKMAGLRLTEKDLLEKYGEPWPDLLYEIFNTETERFLDVFKSLGPFRGVSMEGADDVIKEMHSKNIILGVLSSSPKEILKDRIVKDLSTSGLFDRNIIISRDDVKKHKPDREAFSAILIYLKSKNISPDQVVYCGDHLADFLAARNSGISFIAVTTGINSEKDFVVNGLDERMIIPSIKHLPKRMEELGMI